MTKFDAKRVVALKAAYENAAYVKKVWTVNDSLTLDWKDYAEYIDPMYKHITKAEIIKKARKDERKGTFLKVAIVLAGGTVAEWDLPYNDNDDYEIDFEEGDEFNLDTLKFYTEECLGKLHNFAFGKLSDI